MVGRKFNDISSHSLVFRAFNRRVYGFNFITEHPRNLNAFKHNRFRFSLSRRYLRVCLRLSLCHKRLSLLFGYVKSRFRLFLLLFVFILRLQFFLLSHHFGFNRRLECVGEGYVRQNRAVKGYVILVAYRVGNFLFHRGRNSVALFNKLFRLILRKRSLSALYRNALNSVGKRFQPAVIERDFFNFVLTDLKLHHHINIHRLRVGGVCVHSYVNLLNFRVVFFILARQPKVEIRAGRFNFLNNSKLLNNGNRARVHRVERPGN